MEPERHEVYERIPWETLERRRDDRQWLVYAVAGAVVLAAVAYSFVRTQPPAAPPTQGAPAGTTPPAVATTLPAAPTPTVAAPLVMSEADLYAVDPGLFAEQAMAHAEWFAVEYMAYDGSEQSRQILTALLPGGVPLPSAAEGTQVFIDWAGPRAASEKGPLVYEVEVVVRSLVSTTDSGFTRQPPRLLRVPVTVTPEGVPRVSGVPTIEEIVLSPSPDMELTAVPEEVLALLDPELEVVGGRLGADGSWEVVVLAVGGDGVTRPVTVRP